MATANDIVRQAEAWIGCNEYDGTHKKIIDVYNSHKPLARGYKVKYTDAWCSTFASAVAIQCGATSIIPTECGCQKHIELFKKLGCWVEDENRVPSPGEYIFYDWEDNGSGDNKGYSDHVGIVQKVVGSTIYVIEGNYSNSVKVRKLAVNGRYIRGYGVPKYDIVQNAEKVEVKDVCNVELPVLRKGDKGESVKAMQILLLGYGYTMEGYGADGSFGGATYRAVQKYQKNNGLSVDGICGAQTWGSLLK